MTRESFHSSRSWGSQLLLAPTHSLALNVSVANAMEPPYGECNATDTVPMANCVINCRAEFVVDKCGCRDIYMKNLSHGKKEKKRGRSHTC